MFFGIVGSGEGKRERTISQEFEGII